MKISESKKIAGLKIIQPDIFSDFRGSYISTFNSETYSFLDMNGRKIHFVEDDVSVSKKNVLRGLHGDAKTWKLIQNLVGEIFFVVVDVREESKTHLQWESFNLGESNRSQILVPAGCANGHLCLTEKCAFSYKQSEIYIGADKQFTVAWNDPKFSIPWPTSEPILSERDRAAQFLP